MGRKFRFWRDRRGRPHRSRTREEVVTKHGLDFRSWVANVLWNIEVGRVAHKGWLQELEQRQKDEEEARLLRRVERARERAKKVV